MTSGLVTLGQMWGTADDGLMTCCLQAHGFHPQVQHRQVMTVLPDWGLAQGGMPLQLPAAEAGAAAALLRATGLPVWRRPRLWVLLVCLLGWWMSGVPPHLKGTYLTAVARSKERQDGL